MKLLRILLYAFLVCICLVVFTASGYWYKATHKTTASPTEAISARPASRLKLETKATAAKKFAVKNNYNPKFCFLIDMDLPSGQNRFFIYDLSTDSIMDAGLVTHGRCNESWLNGRKYSNQIGSGCTSPGKYKIGKSYSGKFGLAYKLYGLDSTNNNAFKRYVVLHSHECVPENAVDPLPICQSDGCPTVSAGFLRKLAGMIDQSPKPVLLWIYE
ncbi:MAG: murein L,D-transpeptidase catalytic domain-containing protein [Chitinophagaceae bacterium]